MKSMRGSARTKCQLAQIMHKSLPLPASECVVSAHSARFGAPPERIAGTPSRSNAMSITHCQETACFENGDEIRNFETGRRKSPARATRSSKLPEINQLRRYRGVPGKVRAFRSLSTPCYPYVVKIMTGRGTRRRAESDEMFVADASCVAHGTRWRHPERGRIRAVIECGNGRRSVRHSARPPITAFRHHPLEHRAGGWGCRPARLAGGLGTTLRDLLVSRVCVCASPRA